MTLSYSSRVLSDMTTLFLDESRNIQSPLLAPYYSANPGKISSEETEASAAFRADAGLSPISDALVSQYSSTTGNQAFFVDFVKSAGVEDLFINELTDSVPSPLPSSVTVAAFLSKFKNKYSAAEKAPTSAVTVKHVVEDEPLVFADDIAEIQKQLLNYIEYVRKLIS